MPTECHATRSAREEREQTHTFHNTALHSPQYGPTLCRRAAVSLLPCRHSGAYLLVESAEVESVGLYIAGLYCGQWLAVLWRTWGCILSPHLQTNSAKL